MGWKQPRITNNALSRGRVAHPELQYPPLAVDSTYACSGSWEHHGVVNPYAIPTVTVTDLAANDVPILDVREEDEWAAGHAPGAVHIPMGQLPSRVAELAELDEQQPVYVICRTGGRSARVAAWLNASGWDAVNVSGGMQSWVAEGKPVVSEIPNAEPEIL